MTRRDNDRRGLSRREFLESTGLTTLALSTGALAGVTTMATAAQGTPKAAESAAGAPYNILFILTDQERYFDQATLPVTSSKKCFSAHKHIYSYLSKTQRHKL